MTPTTDAWSGIDFIPPSKIPLREVLTSGSAEKQLTPILPKEEGKSHSFDQPIMEKILTTQVEKQEDIITTSQLLPWTQKLIQAFLVEPPVAAHREELDGYVKKIVEDKAYVVFETSGGPLERAVKLSKLEAINAARQGALIRLVVVEMGPSTNIEFENLEEKGIATWRDKIKDEDLAKYDILKNITLPPKPPKLQ